MKQNKEMIDWFNNYFYNCYYVKHDDFPESIFMFYDKNYVRQLKLAKLEGKKYVEKTDITGICIFQQEWKYKRFRCDYTLIWDYLRNKCSFNYDDIQSFIKDRLEDHTKMNVLTPMFRCCFDNQQLEDHTKMSVLTPTFPISLSTSLLEDHTKMNVPSLLSSNNALKLEDHTKNDCTNTQIDHTISTNIGRKNHMK